MSDAKKLTMNATYGKRRPWRQSIDDYCWDQRVDDRRRFSMVWDVDGWGDIPLYINDYGVVMCYAGSCDFTYEEIGRRTNLAELVELMKVHYREVHNNGGSQTGLSEASEE